MNTSRSLSSSTSTPSSNHHHHHHQLKSTSPSISTSATSAYAYAYPQSDSRTRGRVKLTQLPSSRTPEKSDDLFSSSSSSSQGIQPILHHLSSSTHHSNFQIDQLFRSFILTSIQSTSIYLIKSNLNHSHKPLSLICLQSSLILICIPIFNLIISFQKSINSSSNHPSKLGKRLFGPTQPVLPSPTQSIFQSLGFAIWMVLEQLSLFYALSQLSVLRIIILTASSFYSSQSISNLLNQVYIDPTSIFSFPSNSLSNPATPGLISLFTICACLAVDLHLNPNQNLTESNRLVSGYLAIILCLVAQAFQHLISGDHTNHQQPNRIKKSALILSALIALPIGWFGYLSTPGTSIPWSTILPFGLIYALSKDVVQPLFTSEGESNLGVLGSTFINTASCILVGSCAFGSGVGTWIDYIIGLVSYIGFSQSNQQINLYASATTSSNQKPNSQIDQVLMIYRKVKMIMKKILEKPESRKIYFFLCLNLGFMLVQMLYGVWTNSLGLISDSIHMFFDCMAIGMGLFASVMSTWPADEQFPYGYGRVETLSGFANGVFLILISLFIIFEAIQRLLHPPEMNTNQLLVVSTLGFAVNLVGMFATGHHHHHHGAGGCHSHSHAPAHDHGHSHDHKHDHDHAHDHACASHSHSHSKPSSPDHHPVPQRDETPPRTTSTVHSDSSDHHSPDHSHHHPHSDAHSHTHGEQSIIHTEHDHCKNHDHHDHDHSHTHDHTHDHDHGHSHGHSHNMKGVFLHVMADTLGSLGVIISTLLIERYGWTGFDPLASIFIAVLIFGSVIPLVEECGKVLVLQLSHEKEIEVRRALTKLRTVEGLSSYAAPRFWPLDSSETIIGSIHLQLLPIPSTIDQNEKIRYENFELMKERVRRVMFKEIKGLKEMMIQIEGVDGIRGCFCLVMTDSGLDLNQKRIEG